MSWYVLRLLSLRFAATVVLTASIWFTLWFYDWSALHLGEKYAIAYAWISGVCSVWVAFLIIRKLTEDSPATLAVDTRAALSIGSLIERANAKPCTSPSKRINWLTIPCSTCHHEVFTTGTYTASGDYQILRCKESDCKCYNDRLGCRIVRPGEL
jgi:hypothetical protein